MPYQRTSSQEKLKHQDKKAIQVWAKEIAAAGTGGTPGMTAVVGGRPRPSPCLKLYSFLHPKSKMDALITVDGVEKSTLVDHILKNLSLSLK